MEGFLSIIQSTRRPFISYVIDFSENAVGHIEPIYLSLLKNIFLGCILAVLVCPVFYIQFVYAIGTGNSLYSHNSMHMLSLLQIFHVLYSTS